jgi:chlorobactene glucosyltransferase
MLFFYQILVLLSLLVFLGIVLRNLIDLPCMPAGHSPSGPFVSVLVPARNEALNIVRCIRSLLQQDYGTFEILVLDDASTDTTPELLRSLVSESGGRLRSLKGEPLPEGWHGKSWACFQLGCQAKGERLLFTDADTIHQPDALRRSVAALQDSGADMLSLTPYQELGSFGEKLVVPMVYFILMCFLPLRLVWKSRNPAFSFANGQFILFRKDFYDRINGHAAVKGDLVEDVWLCMAVKKAGGTVTAFNGTDTVSCRMYRNGKDVWDGFSKNLFAGLGYKTPALLAMIVMTALLYIAPYAFLVRSLLISEFSVPLFWLPLLQIAVVLLSRFIVALAFRQPLSVVLLHAFSQFVLLAIAVNSFCVIKFGKGSSWKGRNYNFSR